MSVCGTLNSVATSDAHRPTAGATWPTNCSTLARKSHLLAFPFREAFPPHLFVLSSPSDIFPCSASEEQERRGGGKNGGNEKVVWLRRLWP